MNLKKVLFVGRNPEEFPSVQIRCNDIATRLGCDFLYSVKKVEDVPLKYSVFICVKAELNQDDVLRLSKRGMVIWDIVDKSPPKQGVAIYLVSTKKAKRYFNYLESVEIIPHHHCNFSGIPNRRELRRPGWIGTLHWRPNIESYDHDVFSATMATPNAIANAYRQIGIGINLRAKRINFARHAEINTGIKLINCIGFGIPSVSSDEPAYREIGEDCTIFTDLSGSAYWVHELQNNDRLYLKMRENCLSKASHFHISSVLKMYSNLITSL